MDEDVLRDEVERQFASMMDEAVDHLADLSPPFPPLLVGPEEVPQALPAAWIRALLLDQG